MRRGVSVIIINDAQIPLESIGPDGDANTPSQAKHRRLMAIIARVFEEYDIPVVEFTVTQQRYYERWPASEKSHTCIATLLVDAIHVSEGHHFFQHLSSGGDVNYGLDNIWRGAMAPKGEYWFHQDGNRAWFRKALEDLRNRALNVETAEAKIHLRLLTFHDDPPLLEYEDMRQVHMRHQRMYPSDAEKLPSLIQQAHDMLRYKVIVIKDARKERSRLHSPTTHGLT